MDSLWYTLIIIIFYIIGLALSILALWRSRTPQAATAWIIGLASFPFITLPLFLIFGRNKFYQYVSQRKIFDKTAEQAIVFINKILSFRKQMPPEFAELESILKKSEQPQFLSGHSATLLIDGQETFDCILEHLDKAKEYILFQFYIFRDDSTGTLFKDALIRKAKEGVRVYFMYDYVGSRISKKFLKEMTDAGIKTEAFKGKRSWNYRSQINFRNHRKLVIIDGYEAFVGGHNIGDEYLGKSSRGPWRDTHLLIEGPSAVVSQISFVKDWYWVRQEVLALNWEPHPHPSQNIPLCVVHTGPADNIEVCHLFHLSLIHMARQQLLISTPYFVPSESFMNALILSALGGCKIKILLPLENDNLFVKAAEKVYIERLLPYGIEFYQYSEGFLHQKVLVVDDKVSAIGSSNLDSRSFFINFEITNIIVDEAFTKKVTNMLNTDISKSRPLSLRDMENRSLTQKIFSRACNLLSPIL